MVITVTQFIFTFLSTNVDTREFSNLSCAGTQENRQMLTCDCFARINLYLLVTFWAQENSCNWKEAY